MIQFSKTLNFIPNKANLINKQLAIATISKDQKIRKNRVLFLKKSQDQFKKNRFPWENFVFIIIELEILL